MCVGVRAPIRAYVTGESSRSVKQKYTRKNRGVYNFRYYHTDISNDDPMPCAVWGLTVLAYILGVCERTFGQDWGCSKFAKKRQMPKFPVERGGVKKTRESQRQGKMNVKRTAAATYGIHTNKCLMLATSKLAASGRWGRGGSMSLSVSPQRLTLCICRANWTRPNVQQCSGNWLKELQCVCLSTLAVQNILQPVQQAQTGR